ncbi:MAG: hypothetical protein MUF72_20670 [Elainella sp. Prado103]|jgi:hypothetical protein|nr:hypothetical protein [Elainella sp. Prado103]
MTCALFLLSALCVNPVQAQPLLALALPGFSSPSTATDAQKELLQLLEDEIIPQIANVLTPAQREQFETAIENGASLRKAFKSITLTPEQKSQLGATLGSLSKKDIFATLTPEQKKELFMKKKELFMPTAEEIVEKITEKLKVAEEKVAGKLTPEEIGEKINEKFKMIQTKLAE